MHNIETNSTLVDLSDEIDIKKDKDKIFFTSKFKDQMTWKKYSQRYTETTQKNKIIKGFYKITVKKNIPV